MTGIHQYASHSPPADERHLGGQGMEVSTSSSDRRVLSDRRDTSRPPTHHDWIVEQARALTAKEGAQLTGLTPRGFQEIRAGKAKPSYDTLTNWCRNDKAMAVAYAMHVGAVLPGDAEAVEAMMRGVHAFMRRGAE